MEPICEFAGTTDDSGREVNASHGRHIDDHSICISRIRDTYRNF